MIYLPESSLTPTEASSSALVDFTYSIIVFLRKKYYFPVDSSVFGQCHKYRLCILFRAFYPVAQKMQFLDLQCVQDRWNSSDTEWHKPTIQIIYKWQAKCQENDLHQQNFTGKASKETVLWHL